MIRLIIK